jgi:hypothetical protein
MGGTSLVGGRDKKAPRAVAWFAWVNGQQSSEHPPTVAGVGGQRPGDIVNRDLTKAVLGPAKEHQASQSEVGRSPLEDSSNSSTNKSASLTWNRFV